MIRLLPASTAPEARPVLAARTLRAFADGFLALILPAYLVRLGFDAVTVGLITTATLLGSAATTLGAGFLARRLGVRGLLVGGAGLMAATALGFAAATEFWPLLLIAALAPINPSQGDSTLFAPLEQSVLATAIADRDRTALFARYSLVGSLGAATGALLAGLPDLAAPLLGLSDLAALQAMFVVHAAIGIGVALLYRRLPARAHTGGAARAAPAAPLGPSRRTVWRLAALFSVDAFAGGFLVNSLVALWLFHRFDLSLAATATLFFWTGLLAAVSQLAAAPLARRIGLINTMAFTHVPANICVVAIAFVDWLPAVIVLLLIRGLLAQMDVPARNSYVMAVVTPVERPAAASLTAVPRSLAAALSPALAGQLLAASAFAWPFLLGGGLKIAYDLVLLALFRNQRPPEERRG
ncbi:MAG: MFS transporter [Alphaproteobacteria bacterium]|nr:MFS transporter [Alphaproteobacteria bacterium]